MEKTILAIKNIDHHTKRVYHLPYKCFEYNTDWFLYFKINETNKYLL